MQAIELSAVSKIYRKGFRAIRVPAVIDLSFSVPASGITGFAGPNGAGKTTSIKMILGLVRPTQGTITLRGIDSGDIRARHRVGYVSEIPYFYGHLTARESLAFTYRLHGYDTAKLSSETDRVISEVGLDPAALVKKKLRDLSKGMQQRLNLAHALIGEPELFIFDEPMSGLDPIGRRLFRDIFRRIAATGRPLFFSTHVLEDLESVCDNLVVLSRGRLSYSGGIDEILERGRLGTEITVAELSDAARTALESAGCTIEQALHSGNRIFVPVAIELAAILAGLAAEGIYPGAVTPLKQSLETLLYQNRTDTEE